jgi:hypothetical protein
MRFPEPHRDSMDATWLRALNLIRKNPKATMWPLAVTQLPFAVATAVVFFYLFYEAYPEAEFASFDWLSDAPNGIRLTMLFLGAAQSLFSLVGAAATMVAVNGIVQARPVSLPQALDPAFTRMGGLLLLGVMFNLLMLATLIGLIVVLYFVIRLGIVLQTYVLEERTVGSAFVRSWQLMRGRMFRFMGLLLTAVPFAVVLLFVASLILSIVTAPLTSSGRTAELIVQSIALFAVGAALVPIGAYLATSTTMFYLTAREDAHG